MSDIFSPKNTGKAIQDLPAEEAGVGVTATSDGDVGVAGHVKKDLGKGWTASAQGSWMRKAGGTVSAWLGWKGKDA